MSGYTYTAKTRTGETKTGYLEAADEHAVARVLRQEGLLLVSTEATEKKARVSLAIRLSRFHRVKLTERMLFARYLATMIGAGLPMARALEVLVEQASSKRFKGIIRDIVANVRKGQGLADSLARYPDVFNDLFVNMVHVGEVSGNLEQVLKLLARQMKKDHDLISRVRSAMIYPAVILTALIGIGIIMMIFVVPKLAATFEELDVVLPPTTLLVIGIARLAEAYWYFIPILLLALFILARILLRTYSGRRALHIVFLKFPLIGPITVKVNCARFSRLLSSLLKSGMPIVQSLEIISHTLTNTYYQESLKAAAEEIEHGKQLHDILMQYPKLYPPLVTQMVQVGEETAAIDDLLLRLAIFYESEVDSVTKNLSSVIEPLLMLGIGAAVGFFAISMIQPIYSLVGQF